MSKRASVESPDKLSQNQIKPALQAVMGCLDVNLEEEVSQYRRQRQRSQQWVAPSASLGIQPARDASDLIAPGTDNEQVGALPAQLSEKKLPQPIQFETRSPSQLTIAGNAPSPTLISGAGDRATTTPANSLSSPDDYLESSEELLKSLDAQQSEAETERSLTASLFTPLGWSSMLLFLLSCIALGYTVINPSILTNLSFNRWPGQRSPSPGASPVNTAANNTNKAELPKAPNLASKEFVELDLSTLSNVKPTPSFIPLPSAKPSIPPTPQPVAGINLPNPPIPVERANAVNTNDEGLNNLSRALLPKRSPTPVVPPPLAPSVSDPKRAAAVAQASTPVTSNPGIPVKAQDGYYYVVLDYSNEKSLEQARTAVADAYVRDFPNGVKIQMGALNDPRSAERLVKELQEKGVAAKYYQP